MIGGCDVGCGAYYLSCCVLFSDIGFVRLICIYIYIHIYNSLLCHIGPINLFSLSNSGLIFLKKIPQKKKKKLLTYVAVTIYAHHTMYINRQILLFIMYSNRVTPRVCRFFFLLQIRTLPSPYILMGWPTYRVRTSQHLDSVLLKTFLVHPNAHSPLV
jgi:hypothetical protein